MGNAAKTSKHPQPYNANEAYNSKHEFWAGQSKSAEWTAPITVDGSEPEGTSG